MIFDDVHPSFVDPFQIYRLCLSFKKNEGPGVVFKKYGKWQWNF